MTEPVISVEDLSIEYRIGREWLSAVESVDLRINPLQIHGLVGESGSGKSTVAMAMIHYLARNARISDGRIIFDDQDLRAVTDSAIREVWGNQISLLPQKARVWPYCLRRATTSSPALASRGL